MSTGLVPLPREGRFWCQEKMPREGVGFALCLHGELVGIALVLGRMEQQVAEFVCRGENPALYRGPIPGIDHYGRGHRHWRRH